MKVVGILALQGDFLEHSDAVEKLGFKAKEVKLPQDLEHIDKLIIPGGESTTIGLLAEKYKLVGPLKKFISSGRSVWGTCAGLIFLANHLEKLPIEVRRNALGSQKNSFETYISAPDISDKPFRVLFIRPPRILKTRRKVEVLADYKFGNAVSPVAVKYKNILATTFHSELDADNPITKYFLLKF
ncbi:MAG TPA: pyridoxal 5'-phosphate synthase glutaminase subunit PdxT [Candidatus Saccharimonadales bacterium]|nr:pyridoxal 5'-phosphate synthase glutaminase subunit PdxT [Candidatus Saccharimonadales bacterium]